MYKSFNRSTTSNGVDAAKKRKESVKAMNLANDRWRHELSALDMLVLEGWSQIWLAKNLKLTWSHICQRSKWLYARSTRGRWFRHSGVSPQSRPASSLNYPVVPNKQNNDSNTLTKAPAIFASQLQVRPFAPWQCPPNCSNNPPTFSSYCLQCWSSFPVEHWSTGRQSRWNWAYDPATHPNTVWLIVSLDTGSVAR